MRVTVTGGGGLIGSHLVGVLRARGDEVTVLRRSGSVGTAAWDPLAAPAPAAALEGRDAVIHLAGEPIAQRWTPAVREAIRASRTTGTANLVAGMRAVERPRPACSSARTPSATTAIAAPRRSARSRARQRLLGGGLRRVGTGRPGRT